MLLFGGTGSLFGPILGVISVELLIESLRVLQDYQGFVYGILLLIVIVALPGGLYGGIHSIWKSISSRISNKHSISSGSNGGEGRC